jgi:hypothetical protein
MPQEENLVNGYVKLWPREVFYVEDSQCTSELKKSLDAPGVYILYQDFDVFYVGQAECLFKRLLDHANKRYSLWNHFSAFAVSPGHLDYVEAIMIAATPRTANKQAGKGINKLKIPLPKIIQEKLARHRAIR